MRKPIPFEKIKVGKRYKTRMGVIYKCVAKNRFGAQMQRGLLEFDLQTEDERRMILREWGGKRGTDTCPISRQSLTGQNEYTIVLEIGARKKLSELKPVRAKKMSLVRIT